MSHASVLIFLRFSDSPVLRFGIVQKSAYLVLNQLLTLSPFFHPCMMLGEAFFEIPEEMLYRFAPGRKDCQSDQDKEDALKEGEKEPENTHYKENPADDQNPDFLELAHRRTVNESQESKIPPGVISKIKGLAV